MLNTGLSQRTIEAFSIKEEVNKAMEELDELKEELKKFKHKGSFDSFGEAKKNYGNLLLEMADVEIVLSHLWTIVGNYGVFMASVQEKTDKLRKMLCEIENKKKEKKKK